MSKPKVCVVTGTRAEYGLLRPVIEGILNSNDLDLQLVATGMHLSTEFGLTLQEIFGDGYLVDRRVEMLLSSDTPVGITKSIGLGMIGFADALSELQPDFLLVLGDRFEILAAASSALIFNIPIVHIHGGELTEGAFDDSIRHSITKMSHFHFVAAEEYRKRIINMGEEPERVFLVGPLAIDGINHHNLLNRGELEQSLDFELGKHSFLITFHPVTLEQDASASQLAELFSALDALDDTNFIFTMPNADTDGRILINMVKDFCSTRSHAKAFTSLGQQRYLSCISCVDAVVGNSSSGLTEAPSLGKPTINIGNRQKGRIRPPTVIDCEPNKKSITNAIRHMYSKKFNEVLQNYLSQNPSFENPSFEIVRKLEFLAKFPAPLKSFHDVF